MKILQINNNHYKLGGAEVVYLNTIQLLEKYNNLVISLSRDSKNNLNIASKEYFIPDSNNLVNKFYSRKAAKLIDIIVQNEKPHIAHIHNIIGGITFSVLSSLKKHNIPIIATIHDFRLMCPVYVFMNGKKEICEQCKGGKYFNCIINNCAPEGISKSILVSIESYIRDYVLPFQNLIDRFIFVSSFTKKKFLEVYPEIESKSDVIYNFSDKPTDRRIIRGNYFLFFGRLSYEKGITTLLKTFNDNPMLKLKIIGDGPLKYIVENNKNTNVEYLGYKSGKDLEDLISNSSFVIVPSECYENNPLTIVESYSMSKPVISSLLGGIKEIVVNEVTGFTFKHRESGNLGEVLLKAERISDSKYNLISQNAFEFYNNNFTKELYIQKLLEVYKKSVL
ncbi:MAG: glycosyltransferase [Bacteroidetes bacterium]|nr:glycosyltransferase [Bacteroidota bacterium]